MSGTKEIKRRIKSVKNTTKITKAMELVAASKMKRAVAAAFSSRPYSEYSLQILESISKIKKDNKEDLFEARETAKILIVLVTSNKGLCGGYNAQAVKQVLNFLKANEDKKFEFITIGRKGDTFLRRIGQKIIASFDDLPDEIDFQDIKPITDLIIQTYREKKADLILMIYTHFLSGLLQTPATNQVLPINVNNILRKNPPEKTSQSDFVIEPSYEKIIPVLAEKLTRMQIYQMLLKSNASEQSSRMVAMKNATDAGSEMIDDLTLMFNKARQANITREISEISAGMAS